MKLFAALILASSLIGCAAYQPVPEGYTGPTAKVADTGDYVDAYTKGQIFALMAVDGQRIKDSFWASNMASQGQGFTLSMDVQERKVPVRPMQVTLRGSHLTGAPIHAIMAKAAGTYFSVEGTVPFTPQADTLYVVKGVLGNGASSVWIEELISGKVVTDKVVEK
jgi:hypothetical protein